MDEHEFTDFDPATYGEPDPDEPPLTPERMDELFAQLARDGIAERTGEMRDGQVVWRITEEGCRIVDRMHRGDHN